MTRLLPSILLVLALVSCAQSNEKPQDPFESIKTHIKNATKIEIIHDLSKVSDVKYDKERLIWSVPDSHKVIIEDKKQVAEIKSLITFAPSTAHLGEGGILVYFLFENRPLYTSLINGMFVVHTEDPDRPGFLDKKYKFKANVKLIKKINSMKTKEKDS